MGFIIRNLFFLIFLGLATSLVGGIYYVGYTEQGLRTSLAYATKKIPGQLSIKAIHGKLFSKFTLDGIIFNNDKQQVTINSATLQWNPIGLLRDKFIIENLVLDHPTVRLPTTQNKSTSNEKISFAWLKHIVLEQFVIKQLAVNYADATLHFDGILTKEWNATWQLAVPRLAELSPDASGALYTQGRVSGSLLMPIIQATLNGKNLAFKDKKAALVSGKINIDLQPHLPSTFNLSVQGIDLNSPSIKPLNLKLDGEVIREKKSLTAKLNLLLAKEYKAVAMFALPKFTTFTDTNQPLSGNIKVNVNSLAMLTNYLKDIKNPKGSIEGNVIVDGTLGQPKFSGHANLLNGFVTIPSVGISLEKMLLHAERVNNLIQYQGHYTSSKGLANFHGSLDLGSGNFPLQLSLQGSDIQVMHTREYDISASPNLQLKFEKNVLDMAGNIFITHAKIKLKNFSNTITLPEETIVVDKEEIKAKLPFETTMRLNLDLGDDILFRYKNIVTELRGRIQILQNLYGSINATGELRVKKGTYNAYGQILQIKDGRLIFTGGALNKPALNIRAVKKVSTVQTSEPTSSFNNPVQSNQPLPIYTGMEKITVGVQVAGTFENLNFTLFSIPGGMTQNDILSYLTLGRSSAETSKQLGGSILKAASALSADDNSKFTKLSKNLQNKLGLSELDVAATDVFDPTTGKVTSTTSVVLGKQLAPNLYAHYSKSIFDQMQTLSLRYKLSKRFAIQSETSTMSSGADLLYSIELD